MKININGKMCKFEKVQKETVINTGDIILLVSDIGYEPLLVVGMENCYTMVSLISFKLFGTYELGDNTTFIDLVDLKGELVKNNMMEYLNIPLYFKLKKKKFDWSLFDRADKYFDKKSIEVEKNMENNGRSRGAKKNRSRGASKK